MTVSPGMVDSVPLVGLDPCTAYTVRVVARVGEEFSDEEEVVFTTCDGGEGEGSGDGDPTLDYVLEGGAGGDQCVEEVPQCARTMEPGSSSGARTPVLTLVMAAVTVYAAFL